MATAFIKGAAIHVAGMGLASTASAQSGLCGGVGANGQWIGGSETGSDIAGADTHSEQMALVLAGNEYISLFTLSAPASVRVEAAGRGAGDPQFDLIGADGAIIISDDDSGGNSAARAEVDLDAGTYCMAMSSYDGGPMTAFVRIGLTSHEPLTEGVDATPGDSGDEDISGSCGEAGSLGVMPGILTSDASVDDAPFRRFTLEQSMAISVTAENEDADPVLTLYDGDAAYLTENDDHDGLNSRIDMADPLAPGEYCIGVKALNDASLPILVTVTEYDPEAALAALYDRGDAAPPMDGTVPITDLGSLSSRLRQDAQITDSATWYSLNIDQGGLLVIEAISADGNGDPWVAVYDDLGRQLGINDDHGDGLDSFLAARVQAGTYLIAVKEVSAETTSFVRMVFERYIPAK